MIISITPSEIEIKNNFIKANWNIERMRLENSNHLPVYTPDFYINYHGVNFGVVEICSNITSEMLENRAKEIEEQVKKLGYILYILTDGITSYVATYKSAFEKMYGVPLPDGYHATKGALEKYLDHLSMIKKID